MSKYLRLVSAVSAFTIAAAFALPAMAKDPTPQQQRMSTCNTQATGKKGDERKAFMSSCLKGSAAASPAKITQQQKMVNCNKDATAKSLKGDARKSFMSTCLKG
jgi:hypothetical protein